SQCSEQLECSGQLQCSGQAGRKVSPVPPTRRSQPSKSPNGKSPRGLSRTAVQERFEEIVSNIGKVIKGKDDMIRLALTALTADGHIVFEDMPGTGKTML